MALIERLCIVALTFGALTSGQLRWWSAEEVQTVHNADLDASKAQERRWRAQSRYNATIIALSNWFRKDSHWNIRLHANTSYSRWATYGTMGQHELATKLGLIMAKHQNTIDGMVWASRYRIKCNCHWYRFWDSLGRAMDCRTRRRTNQIQRSSPL